MVKHVLRILWLLPRNAAILMVSAYQQTLSPDHGPLKDLSRYGYCRHQPSCSAYAKDVLRERGLVVGSVLTLRRLLTCHPWAKPTRIP